MAQEASTIVLQVDSTGVRRANSDLDSFAAKGKKAEASTVAMSSAMRGLGAAVSVGSIALMAKQALQMADAYTNMSARLSLVTRNSRELADVQKALFTVAQNTRVDLEETSTLYSRLASSTTSLGVSQRELLVVTDAINKAMVISGASAASAQAALVQLGQGFASGTLRGEELNSVMEQAPRLAQAIADGLGVTRDKLRQLGSDGEITAEKLFRALQSSAASLSDEFGKIPVTVGGATTKVSNSILVLIGTLDQLTGTSSAVSGWASKVSASLDGINARVSKSGGIWRGYVNAISEDFSRARLEATRAELDRMAGAVKNAQEVLRDNPSNPYAKDTLREFSELSAAVKKYEADIKRIQGIDVSAKATAQPGGRQRDISSATVASVSAALAREQTALAARKEFLKDYASAEEKFTAELKKQKEAQGDLFTPEDEARLRKKFFPQKNATSGATLDFVKGDVGSVQRELDTLTNTYANAERVLEATRNAGLISERKYYDEKLIFLELNTAAQVASLKAENDAIEARARKGQKGLDDDRKVADNLAQITILQERAGATARVMGIEQEAAAKRVTQGYVEARIAATQYLDTVAKQNQREIAAAAFGPKAQGRARERGQIEDKFQGQINDAYADNRRGQLKDDDLQNRLSNLKQMQEAEIALAEEKYAALDALDKSWQAGLSISVNTYLDETANISKQVQSLVGQTTKGLEDAFVDFAMTGKASFSDLASSFIRELLRMEARAAISAIFRAIVGDQSGGAGGGAGGLFGALFGAVAGPKAIGGPVSAGSMYQVNERGPELLNAGGKQYLMMGSQSGSVTPNNGLRGGDSTTINVAAGPTRNEVMTAIQLGMQAVRSETDVKLRKAGILR